MTEYRLSTENTREEQAIEDLFRRQDEIESMSDPDMEVDFSWDHIPEMQHVDRM